jgi:hypothetical protein
LLAFFAAVLRPRAETSPVESEGLRAVWCLDREKAGRGASFGLRRAKNGHLQEKDQPVNSAHFLEFAEIMA